MASRDIIAAASTAPGRAAIGIVRVSGPDLSSLVLGLIGRPLAPRYATHRAFRDAHGEPIDRGIALYFPAPASYTGEDVLELHGHGGAVVLRALLQRCFELGARPAEPGEFTRRAFLAGKIDLVQAESVIDLIDASTAQAARSAMRSLEGAFSSAIQALDRDIVELRALVEAMLDFPEEEVDVLGSAQRRARVDGLVHSLGRILEAARQGSLLREGMHIVLAGQPNVGKSSLLNRLAGRDLAIVTAIPGTTRDAIREAIDIAGVPAHVVDTAGLRESEDPIEKIGVERAWGAIERADVILQLIDAREGIGSADEDILRRLPAAVPRVVVMNKIDLVDRAAAVEETDGNTTVWLSARTGEGMDLLRETLLKRVGWQSAHAEHAFLARDRHLRALAEAKAHLLAAAERPEPELYAEELRLAHQALGSITGAFTSDDLLGEIFQRFCVGK